MEPDQRMAKEDIACLNRASITYDYLHANSTTHEFLFGAVAELVDNARDATANSLAIDFDEDSSQLSFLDDGCGMDKAETIAIASFGHSLKKIDSTMIGQYGNGLKSGALRISKDFVLLTKKDGLFTALLLSRTFHEKNGIKEVIVPSPSFTVDGQPYWETEQERHKHNVEMSIMLQWSPWHTEREFLQQFNRIASDSGTLVVCFNPRRIDTGAFEMDLETDPLDIRLRNVDSDGQLNEMTSLRAYLAILYMNPRMRVSIRGKKVATKRMLSSLFKPRQYNYTAKSLRAAADRQHEKCRKELSAAKDHLGMCKSERGEFERTHQNYMGDKILRVRARHLQNAIENAEKMVNQAEQQCFKMEKAKKQPIMLQFFFGLNILQRNQYGCMIYNNGRLIRMYEKMNAQKDKSEMRMKNLGVVGIVDVPYSLLEPTHNKQSFADHREYAMLLKAMNDHMEQYWKDIALFSVPGGVPGFWQSYGYPLGDWASEPSNEMMMQSKRYREIGFAVQCNDCLKWRHLSFAPQYLKEDAIPDAWNCRMHPDTLFQQCSRMETMPKIAVGQLVRTHVDASPTNSPRVANNNPVATRQPAGTSSSINRAQSIQSSPTSSSVIIDSPRRSTRVIRRSPSPVRRSSPPMQRKRRAMSRRNASASIGSSRNSRLVESSSDDEDEETSGEDEPVSTRQRRRSYTPSGKATTKADLMRNKKPTNGAIGTNSRKATTNATVNLDQSDEDQAVEDPQPAPKSTTNKKDEKSAVVWQQKMEAMNRLRRLFTYFKPPKMQTDFGQMTDEQLLTVDMENFTQSYEDGLRELLKRQNPSGTDMKLRENCVQMLKLLDKNSADVNVTNVEDRVTRFLSKRQ